MQNKATIKKPQLFLCSKKGGKKSAYSENEVYVHIE